VLIAQAELHAHAESRPARPTRADGGIVGTAGVATDAARRLDEARAIGEQLGAAPLLARLDHVATRLAAPTTAFPRGLTTREVDVLRLVAEGLTDAQVAERLVLSPRTVSQHLRSVYNKLGVSSRAAATRFAIEHRLDAA
jgi:DNA-binding NarL/FixJ family response regulator